MSELCAKVNLPLQHFLPPRDENHTINNFYLQIACYIYIIPMIVLSPREFIVVKALQMSSRLTHFFGILHYIAHISRISAYEKDFGSWGHLYLEHEYFCDRFTTKLSEILHIYNSIKRIERDENF